jgi:hypothetical protein
VVTTDSPQADRTTAATTAPTAAGNLLTPHGTRAEAIRFQSGQDAVLVAIEDQALPVVGAEAARTPRLTVGLGMAAFAVDG